MTKRGLNWRVGIVLIALLLWSLAATPMWANVQGETGSTHDAWLELASGSQVSVSVEHFLFPLQGEVSISWEQFLRWASNPTGIPLIVGIFLSVLVEYWPAFRKLTKKWKRAVFFGLSLVIPLLAVSLGVMTLGWPPSWKATFWPALVAGVMAFGSGTLTHLPKLPDAPDEDLPVTAWSPRDDGSRTSGK